MTVYKRVESLGSIVLIDETDSRYMRMPKQEQPRERPEWGDASAGALQDGVWHGFTSWRVDVHPLHTSIVGPCCQNCPGLIIETDSGGCWFPRARVLESRD